MFAHHATDWQVNEFLSEDLSLAEVQAAVAGNRGTQVAFRFRRKIAEGDHRQQTQITHEVVVITKIGCLLGRRARWRDF